MNVFAVLATGPSMSQSIADRVHAAGIRAVAVCDAFRLAPWADALVCNDQRWWRQYPEALQFAGRKFCGSRYNAGTEWMPPTMEFPPGTNSGLQGMRVARALGATRILLLGFDMHANGGRHYFGDHPAMLLNSGPAQFKRHLAQFDAWQGGCDVVNCTPGSALLRFPMSDIDRELGVAVAA